MSEALRRLEKGELTREDHGNHVDRCRYLIVPPSEQFDRHIADKANTDAVRYRKAQKNLLANIIAA